jgi:hypothetical protein
MRAGFVSGRLAMATAIFLQLSAWKFLAIRQLSPFL